MKLIRTLLLPVLFVAMWSLTGCNEEPMTSVSPDTTPGLSKLPAGAVVSNATFNVYVHQNRDRIVTVHKVNVPWIEATETFNIFFARTPAPLWDAGSLGSFNANTTGYKSVNITALVQSWIADPTTNNGILLDQLSWPNCPDPLTEDLLLIYYHSRENTNKPYLEVTYTVDGGTPQSTMIYASEDTYLHSEDPDYPYGASNMLYQTRWDEATCEYLKLPLFKFDLTPVQNCETAYAYGEGASLQTLCFLDIPNIQGNNWGWTNQIGTGTYNWPIYAGAGQCDITKGTVVGNLNVVYAAGTATITFQPDPGVTLGDTHVWVGTNGNMLPFRNGNWLTAPGSFNYNDMNPVVVNGLSGNIWIAAHSGEACW